MFQSTNNEVNCKMPHKLSKSNQFMREMCFIGRLFVHQSVMFLEASSETNVTTTPDIATTVAMTTVDLTTTADVNGMSSDT